MIVRNKDRDEHLQNFLDDWYEKEKSGMKVSRDESFTLCATHYGASPDWD